MSAGAGSKRKPPVARTARSPGPPRPRTPAGETEGGAGPSRLARLVTFATTPWTGDDVRRWWRAWLKRMRPRWRRASRVGKQKLAQAHERGATLVGRAAFALVGVGLIVTAPFLVLVRGAVWLYEHHGFPVWLALAAAGAAVWAARTA